MAIRDDFTAGEVLAAADLNDTFASKLNLAGGKVLQVLSVTKTDTFTTTSTSYVDVTGLTVAVTPASSSNKILIIAQVAAAPTNVASSGIHMKINGGNSSAYVGGAAGSRSRDIGMLGVGSQANGLFISLAQLTANYLDAPATTSAITYAVQVRVGSSGTVYINRNHDDTDAATSSRGASTLTVMEISA